MEKEVEEEKVVVAVEYGLYMDFDRSIYKVFSRDKMHSSSRICRWKQKYGSKSKVVIRM